MVDLKASEKPHRACRINLRDGVVGYAVPLSGASLMELLRKTVFIAHPIAGDIEGNMKKVLAICEEVHTSSIIPVAPYLVSLQYLKDEVVEDRRLGAEANFECFHRGYVDELWLFGDRISNGMREEILLARELGVPIIAKTKETERDLKGMVQ